MRSGARTSSAAVTTTPARFVRAIIDRFAALPRVLYDMSEPDIEASHFSVWFNAIARRPWYDNDAISDLYYLHEFKHAAGMTYQDGMPWNRWFTKMVSNEFEASFCTEVQAYFRAAGSARSDRSRSTSGPTASSATRRSGIAGRHAKERMAPPWRSSGRRCAPAARRSW